MSKEPVITRIDHSYSDQKLISYLADFNIENTDSKILVYCAGISGFIVDDYDKEGISTEDILMESGYIRNKCPEISKILFLDNKGFAYTKEFFSPDFGPDTIYKSQKKWEVQITKMLKLQATNENYDQEIYQDVINKLHDKNLSFDPKNAIGLCVSFGGRFTQNICKNKELSPKLAIYFTAMLDHTVIREVPSIYIMALNQDAIYYTTDVDTTNIDVGIWTPENIANFEKYVSPALKNNFESITQLNESKHTAPFKVILTQGNHFTSGGDAYANLNSILKLTPYLDTPFSSNQLDTLVDNLS